VATLVARRSRRIACAHRRAHAVGENDPLAKAPLCVHSKRCRLGWTDAATCGWTFGGAAVTRIGSALAAELVGLQPDIIVVAASTPATVCVQGRRGHTDRLCGRGRPVASGIGRALDRRLRNITGFASFEPRSQQWLELLSRSRPAQRVAIMFNPERLPYRLL